MKIVQSSSGAPDYRELLAFLMHELRRIQDQIQREATVLSEACRGETLDAPKARRSADKVIEEAMVLQAWLSIADVYIDPSQFSREPLHIRSLYRLFDRALNLVRGRLKSKGIRVTIRGEGDFAVSGYGILAVLPFVLLDNAIKYSPVSGHIDVTLNSQAGLHEVQISSMGPHVADDEMGQLGQPGVRGKWARELTHVGNGQGLMLAKTICSLHGGELVLTSGSSPYVLNGIPHAEFTAIVRLPA